VKRMRRKYENRLGGDARILFESVDIGSNFCSNLWIAARVLFEAVDIGSSFVRNCANWHQFC
jgi:hypothetical protein